MVGAHLNDVEEVQRHLALVEVRNHHHLSGNSNSNVQYSSPAVTTAPFFTSKVKSRLKSPGNNNAIFSIYGHLGLRLATYKDGEETQETQPEDNLIYSNVNAPWSAFICGSQGAGKSHTLSCLLENALLSDGQLEPNPNPLAGIVFHYDKHSGQGAGQICEAAYLASNGINVEVFVSPSNFWKMEKLYNLPGVPANTQPTVRPLLLLDD